MHCTQNARVLQASFQCPHYTGLTITCFFVEESTMLLAPDASSRQINVYRQHLAHSLENIWEACFPDTRRVNLVELAYGQPWKRRLGLIRLSLHDTRTFIGVN